MVKIGNGGMTWLRAGSDLMATNEQMQKEFDIFGAVWRLFKKYYDIRQTDSDERWEFLIREGTEIMRRYDCPLCRNLVNVVLDELERVSKTK